MSDTRSISSERKHLVRLMAVQAAYGADISGDEEVLENMDDQLIQFYYQQAVSPFEGGEDTPPTLTRQDKKFFRSLITGLQQEIPQVDVALAPLMKEDWPLERMSGVVRAVLRAAAYEMLMFEGTPARVVISEYVRIADSLLEEKDVGFCNAVLEKLAKGSRKVEFV